MVNFFFFRNNIIQNIYPLKAYPILLRDTSASISFPNHMIVNELYGSVTCYNPSLRNL